jgi:hypothetical protein
VREQRIYIFYPLIVVSALLIGKIVTGKGSIGAEQMHRFSTEKDNKKEGVVFL